MDKQRANIELLSEHSIRLKTGRVVETINPVISLSVERDEIYWRMNHIPGRPNSYKYIGCCNLSDYINHALYNFNIKFNSSDLTSRSVVYDTGYSQVALTGVVLNTTGKQKTYMYNYNRFDCRRENIYSVAES